MTSRTAGTLYVVSTPIGNLGDLSPRAEETLRGVSRILAEDTRRSRLLAERAGSSARLVSLHEHNERERIDVVVGWLNDCEDLALVSDAGTPLVSDPGARLVAAVLAAGCRVVPIPGPSAVIAALVASGLPTERFTFLGFPERKGRARQDLLERVAGATESVVLFESPQRLVTLLAALGEVCGPDRLVAVARELTKIHEEVRRGTLAEVAGYYEANPPKGEVTLVVAPAEQAGRDEDREEEARSLALELLNGGMKPSQAAKEVALRLALARNEAYRIVHDLDAKNTTE
ncbi:MAG: 16S rRNA (cytidine(1402)-2'-O)-methyltransferase [Gemmatimonadota bacterium]|nr:16S rRNA (cytidine(1402)-2'-O)-methyltransferase [Gemmatimonadota bacterium]